MRMLKETLCVLLLWASLEETQSRGCSSFFCRKSHLVSALSRGSDPGKPLFLTPYLEKGNIEEGSLLYSETLFCYFVQLLILSLMLYMAVVKFSEIDDDALCIMCSLHNQHS
uniref:Secreted protein n=1 Tax=Hucho hucho TaxID=62062 RepID=A0A4W5KCN6_9TELE